MSAFMRRQEAWSLGNAGDALGDPSMKQRYS
jgi:hypothetical protein